MATWQDVITAAQTLLQRWKRDVDFTSQIVNGPATGPASVVNTDGGTIPTFAKTVADIIGEGQSLRSDLANATDPAKGAALVGFLPAGTGAVGAPMINKAREWVSVADYGAVADKTTDDTLAFERALATGKRVRVPRPAAGMHYLVGDIDLPTGAVLFGDSTPLYNPSGLSDFYGECALVLKDGATTLFSSLAGASGRASFEGLLFHGKDKTRPLIHSTGTVSHLRFLRCGAYTFTNGFGGDVYFGSAEFIACNAAQNINGFANLIDSKIVGGYANANTVGVNLGAGANDVTILGLKNEWNTGENYKVTNAQNIVLIGGVCDRAGNAGMRIAGAAQGNSVIIVGTKFRRNGYANIGTNESAHIYVEGSTSVVVNGVQTKVGVNDDGGGTNSPSYSVSYGAGTVSAVITGNDLTGAVTTPIRNGSIPATYVQRDNIGVDPQVNTTAAQTSSGRQYIASANSGNLTPAGGTVTVSGLNQPAVGAFSRLRRKALVSVRNVTSGASLYGEIAFMLSREGGSASVVVMGKIFEGAANTVGTAGTDAMQIGVTNVAADGSTFDVVFTNNHATSTLSATLDWV